MVARTADKRFGALGRMGLVAVVHVAALYLIATSLGIVPPILENAPEDIETTIVDRQRPPDVPPPDTTPPLVRHEFHFPIPEVPPIATDEPPPLVIDQGPPDIPIGPPVIDTVVPDNLVSVRGDPRHPLTQPAYPASYIRQGIQGDVDVEILVQPNGRIGDARVVRSSGYDLFDRAALDEARRNWRMLPATRNGEPYAQWYRLRVVFKLKNQQ